MSGWRDGLLMDGWKDQSREEQSISKESYTQGANSFTPNGDTAARLNQTISQ